ncbi:hypothetical protein [Streptomyces sp. NPDC047070]|uniref:hypothetical protein n=1 Tax=Streptomyces sp. NPDC047070 TaxID=3154923 RepID=UPI0034514B21
MFELETIAADWPALPPQSAFRADEDLLARADWPALSLTWWGIRPVGLEADRESRHITTSLLHAEGAPAPVAIVGMGPVPGGRHRGWYWRCRVHVIGAHCDPAVPVNADCTAQGRATTEASARDWGRQHVIDTHPDAAVPYLARRAHALRTWN